MKHQRPSPTRSLESGVRAAILRRLAPRSLASGRLTAPCVPSRQPELSLALEQLFVLIDRPLTEERRQGLRQLLAASLREGFDATPHAELTVKYHPEPGEPLGVRYEIEVAAPSAEELYFAWARALAPAPAPREPDPSLLQCVLALALPAKARVLEVGPGVRHTLELARSGLRVDAFEPLAERARELESQARALGLPVKVSDHDALDESVALPAERYDAVVLSDVAVRLGPSELGLALLKLGRALKPGGALLVSSFLYREGDPGDAFRERAQREFQTCYMRSDVELQAAQAGLRLQSETTATPLGAPPPALELRWWTLAKA